MKDCVSKIDLSEHCLTHGLICFHGSLLQAAMIYKQKYLEGAGCVLSLTDDCMSVVL